MGQLSDIALIIWGNLLGFDMLVFAAAASALFCYLVSRRLSIELHKTLHQTIFLPEYLIAKKEIALTSELDLIDVRKRANGFYAVFSNLTGIFPLLGILGTVISLIPIVADMENMQKNFSTALTSTFWGLVFAIIFKFLDGFLSTRMEENSNNIALYLERKRNINGETPCETKV